MTSHTLINFGALLSMDQVMLLMVKPEMHSPDLVEDLLMRIEVKEDMRDSICFSINRLSKLRFRHYHYHSFHNNLFFLLLYSCVMRMYGIQYMYKIMWHTKYNNHLNRIKNSLRCAKDPYT